MNRNYAIIGVEGPQDQAFLGKVLKFIGFQSFDGQESKLEPFWHNFIPHYPRQGNLYKRLDMPSILLTETLSVAIYSGEGSNLGRHLRATFANHPEYKTDIVAFGIVADSDNKHPDTVAQNYCQQFQNDFPGFPNQAGICQSGPPRTGIYVLPNNQNEGVLDSLLCECGNIVYPELMNCAIAYLNGLSEEQKNHWGPFDDKKALVATVVSVLKPGKTNTTSIADNNWVSKETQQQVPALANFIKFLSQLLELS
jgi:hypothetical protein